MFFYHWSRQKVAPISGINLLVRLLWLYLGDGDCYLLCEPATAHQPQQRQQPAADASFRARCCKTVVTFWVKTPMTLSLPSKKG